MAKSTRILLIAELRPASFLTFYSGFLQQYCLNIVIRN